MSLTIAHLSFSSGGGAGTVARRLAEIQRHQGHKAQVINSLTGSLRDSPWESPQHTLVAAIDDMLIRRRDFSGPISLYRNALSTRVESALTDADVIHVHWPYGQVPFSRLAPLAGGRPVVWTLHDMRAFTGACHYSMGCRGFEKDCQDCPAVKSPWRKTVSVSLSPQRDALEAIPALQVVSPSQWLADQARASRVMSTQSVDVIPNPLPLSHSSPEPVEAAKKRLGLDAQDTVLFVSAASLDDPVKAVSVAIDAFRQAQSGGAQAVLFVAGRTRQPPSTNPRVRYLGFISETTRQEVLAATDYVIVSSLAENQPLAISEAQALGASLIARNSTGLPEHLDIDPDGRLFDSTEDLVDILRALSGATRTDQQRQTLARATEAKFSPETISTRYLSHYNALGSF